MKYLFFVIEMMMSLKGKNVIVAYHLVDLINTRQVMRIELCRDKNTLFNKIHYCTIILFTIIPNTI